ncbi:MAG: PadR family transcriptional regulator, partial [Actinomycetota bacterium]|nr:PadR family transcriptional regulator [Actinomycetota bacterium]
WLDGPLMSPVFAHGQLRLYVLTLLDDGPRHGYEVIQDLESRFNGLYSPSAGTVYPRLAKLEEEGLVERSDEGRKATYRITDAGRAEVRARQGDVHNLRADLDQSVRQLAEDVRSRVQHQARDLRAELKNAAREARATATPVGGRDSWDDGGAYADVERAVNTFRNDVRRAWRRGGLTTEQTREVVDILSNAATRIRAVVADR